MFSMAHESGSLNSAACHGSQLREGHSQRSHACVLTVGDADTVGEGLDSADALEASTGSHGFLHDGVQRYILQGTLGELLHCLIDILVLSDSFIDGTLFGDHLAGSVGIQLVGSLRIQP